MPYTSLSQLPKGVKDHLPVHAQEIYKEAFNNAYAKYDTEKTACKVAWSAVKQKYEKGEDGMWHLKGSKQKK